MCSDAVFMNESIGVFLSFLGFDIGTIDLISIQTFCRRVISLTEYRKSLAGYLTSKMTSVAPNLAALIGEQVHFYQFFFLY